MLRGKNDLIENRGLNNPINYNDALNDNQLFLTEMNNQGRRNNGIAYLPENPPFEFHNICFGSTFLKKFNPKIDSLKNINPVSFSFTENKGQVHDQFYNPRP